MATTASAGPSNDELAAQIDALRTRFVDYSTSILERNRTYLRAFSPQFNSTLGEHDQWSDPIRAKDAGHTRSSFQIVRPVVELWTALEASDFPTIRFRDPFLPAPIPDVDPTLNAQRIETYRARKLVNRHLSTLREEAIRAQVRRARLNRHYFRAVRKKNLYGHSWIKLVPDLAAQTFSAFSNIDPSTVFPVWSAWDDTRLDAVLVAYRKSARTLARQFPGSVRLTKDGSIDLEGQEFYQPSHDLVSDYDRTWVWVEDYWMVDPEYAEDVVDDEPINGLVVNVIRVNGKIVSRAEYPGWRRVPYFLFENEDERGHLGFSDVGTVLPIQEGINRFVSQQQDVIAGESRPKFKYRGDSDRTINLKDEEVVSLDQDEDIEQIAVRLDVFPTQVHGTQMFELLARSTGLNDSVWGRIVASQNSGRALNAAWRSVAARLLPRMMRTGQSIDELVSYMIDVMELYNWNNARELFAGERDFEPDFPNQEPKDFQEVTLDAINRLNAGLVDQVKAMELTGEESPDEMQERVRADYLDTVLHPEKAQSYYLLQRLQNQIAIEAQQAGIQAQQAQMQMAQMGMQAPGGAPSGAGTPDQQAGAAAQANVQAQAQAAPTLAEGQNGPAAQPDTGNAATKFSTLVQDGRAANRIIDQGVIGG